MSILATKIGSHIIRKNAFKRSSYASKKTNYKKIMSPSLAVKEEYSSSIVLGGQTPFYPCHWVVRQKKKFGTH